jgi:secreted trypsin-like serine protease
VLAGKWGLVTIGLLLGGLPGCGTFEPIPGPSRLPAKGETPVQQETKRGHGTSGPPISDAGLEAVGGLIRPGPFGGSPQLICTGTLVGPATVLTAKHCINKVNAAQRSGCQVVFAVGPSIQAPTQTVTVSTAEGAPGEEGGWNRIGRDIGIVHLAGAVNVATPMSYDVLKTNQVGSTFVAVGYGVNSADRTFGKRRVTALQLRATAGRTYEALFGDFVQYWRWYAGATPPVACKSGDGEQVCALLSAARALYEDTRLDPASEAVAGGAPEVAQPCFGDSGGPLLQRSAQGAWTVHAVLSGGVNARHKLCDHGAVYAAIDSQMVSFLDAQRARAARLAGATRL